MTRKAIPSNFGNPLGVTLEPVGLSKAYRFIAAVLGECAAAMQIHLS
jgi:hypothetical protein